MAPRTRATIVIALLLIAAAAIGIGGLVLKLEANRRTAPGAGPQQSPFTSTPTAVIYYASGKNELTALDWTGRPAGVVKLPPGGPTQATPDGQLILDWPRVVDRQSAVVVSISLGRDSEVDVAWARSGTKICLITSGPGQGPDNGGLALLVGDVSGPLRRVATIGQPRSNPSIAACDPSSKRIVVVDAIKTHVGLGGPPFMEVLRVQVLDAENGAVLYTRAYPPNYDQTVATTVVASRDGRYAAENSAGGAVIRDLTTGGTVANLTDFSVVGFSDDPGSTLVAGFTSQKATQVLKWSTGSVVWSVNAVIHGSTPRPNYAEVLLYLGNPVGLNDLVAVGSGGESVELAHHVFAAIPCPCPGSNVW